MFYVLAGIGVLIGVGIYFYRRNAKVKAEVDKYL